MSLAVGGAGEARQVRAPRAKPTGQRATLRLTPAHFALYRAYLEGIEERTLHTHCGAPGTDVRVTRRTLATLRDTLTIAAWRASDRDAVHLLRLKPGSLQAEAHAGGADGAEGEAALPPTLDAFRDAIDPDHVYSERDLLSLYLETYPPARSPTIDRKVARDRRLRERQDAVLVEAPRPDHELEGWFAPFLVTRLAEAGVATFAQLLGLIRRRRQWWYTAVPRLGAVGAERIIAFVDQHAESLGYLSPLAMTPRRQLPAGHPALRPVARAPADVTPLEPLRVPAELDGSAGLNRAPVPAHQAELNTDLQARAARPRAARTGARPNGCCCGRSSPRASRCRRPTRWMRRTTWSGSWPTRSRPSAGSGGAG
ncbi:phage integrase family protein [Burkholderia gladioli]|uniref:phage integrase family protein n=1 Tax=Burkholderia gladioli TaxID=28095 RepID=UPI001FC7D62F|nr:phage integrase family protein [Burkholderia gladioli]